LPENICPPLESLQPTVLLQVAQLYSVAEASKNETGGGEGVEVRDFSGLIRKLSPLKAAHGIRHELSQAERKGD
jgi:hypothetical protein